MQSKLALTKSPSQKATSTNLSMVPGRIRKSADPFHVLFVCRDELIHRLQNRSPRRALSDLLPISQEIG